MLFVLHIILFASSAVAANVSSCATPVTYLDFYECTLLKHPKMAVAQEKVREAEAVYDRAAQWKNPNLSVKSIGAQPAGEAVGSTEITLLVPISQLWTRGAQKGMAFAEKRVVEVEAKQALLEFKKALIHDLNRLRQIDDDFGLIDGSLQAFAVIRKQLGARRARSPDQEITLSLVELASSEYQLRRNHFQVEKAEIFSRLKAIWGQDFEIKREFLPPLREAWPTIPVTEGVSQNLTVQKAVAEAERALAEYSLTKLESLPYLGIGPIMQRTTTGPNQYWSYGFALEASVPIFSLNGGARAVVKSKNTQAELESAFAIRKFSFEKENLLKKYRYAVESLSKSSSRNEVKKKLQRVDSYFRQGLAGGATVIEAHRQIVEYHQSQNEHEDAAIDAYIDLMTLTGGEIEGILK